MSALLSEADVCDATSNVRFGPKADIPISFDHFISALLHA
jgi:hypothetical protein